MVCRGKAYHSALVGTEQSRSIACVPAEVIPRILLRYVVSLYCSNVMKFLSIYGFELGECQSRKKLVSR